MIANFIHPFGRAEEETIRGFAKGHGLETAPTVFHEYQVHWDGSFQGKTAPELQPDSKAAAEVNALWDWLCAELSLTTPALVHKVAWDK